MTNVEDWRWVPSRHNPADEATKWGKGPLSTAESMWFKGPDFLRKSETEWPKQREIGRQTDEELRPCHAHRGFSPPEQLFDLERFSKLTKLVRVAACVHRFVDNLRKKQKNVDIVRGHLQTEELRRGESTLIRLVQWECFADELVQITRNQNKPTDQQTQLTSTSGLHKLSPVIDENGILRVDGRIGAAQNVQMETKYPIILPRNHRFTHLVMDEYHRTFRHANAETIVNEIRQYYYIPRLRTGVRKIEKVCQWCKIYRSKPKVPRMSPLPLARMAAFIRPFTYVGLDFFGPLTVKIGRSDSKRWIALFTCLTTRAVHVEVAYSLSTESCVKCVRRFVCRRGSPAEIYSDNGTNFVGANKQLKQQMEQTTEDLIATFTNANTKWLFNPPGTPHMGGSWERLVRSIKTALETAYNNNRKLDDEGLETLVVEAEAIVNSRPLTYLPLDSEESEALTPNHFLLGSSNGIRQPMKPPTDTRTALKSSYDQIQLQLDMFWKRWTREYLPTLTTRPKWHTDVKPLAEGDLVVIVDESRRNSWTRGRIVQVIKGEDGRTRQALVETARGVMRRSAARLVVLEVQNGSKTGSGDDGQCYGGEIVTGSTGQSGATVGDDRFGVAEGQIG